MKRHLLKVISCNVGALVIPSLLWLQLLHPNLEILEVLSDPEGEKSI